MITHALDALTGAVASRRGKWIALALWLLVVVVLTLVAPKLADHYANNTTQLPGGDPSQVARRLQLAKFPSQEGAPAIVVFSDRGGLTADDQARARQVSDWLRSAARPAGVDGVVSIFTTPGAAGQLVSPDGTTMTMVVAIGADAVVPNVVKAMRAYLVPVTHGSSLRAYVTGPAGLFADTLSVFTSGNLDLTLATLVLVLVLLLIVYRSPLLPLLPVLAVGLALQVATALLGYAAQTGIFGVSQQADSIATVLLFGAGTDYSIFIASRFREELRHTPDKYQAMRTTMRAVGEAITSSAGTVILALLTLTLAALSLYSSLGPTMAVTIAVMLVAGLTLVPALLVTVGRAAFWPFTPRFEPDRAARRDQEPRGFWGWLGSWTARHRVAATAGSLVLLAVLALGNIGIVRSYNFLTAFRVATDATTGYQVLRDHFPAGTLAPTTAVIELAGSDPDVYSHLVELDAVTAAIAADPHVARVEGPTRPAGGAPTTPPAALQAEIAMVPASVRAAIRSGQVGPPVDPRLAPAIAAYAATVPYVSTDGTTVQLSVVFVDDPYAQGAIGEIARVRAAARTALNANGLGGGGTSATVALAGQTAELADTQADNARDTRLIVPVTLALVGVVLALLLRSLIAPLYLLAAVTLNFFAAIGICGLVFQRVQGQDGVYYAIPLYTFIFLVALGADYTIFLMSRVREEAGRHGLEAGTPLAVSATGGVITSAGVILAGTFAVLTTLPLTLLYQFGVCVAVGVLLDTLVVRGLFVPGVVLLLGRWNWWPGRDPDMTRERGARALEDSGGER